LGTPEVCGSRWCAGRCMEHGTGNNRRARCLLVGVAWVFGPRACRILSGPFDRAALPGAGAWCGRVDGGRDKIRPTLGLILGITPRPRCCSAPTWAGFYPFGAHDGCGSRWRACRCVSRGTVNNRRARSLLGDYRCCIGPSLAGYCRGASIGLALAVPASGSGVSTVEGTRSGLHRVILGIMPRPH